MSSQAYRSGTGARIAASMHMRNLGPFIQSLHNMSQSLADSDRDLTETINGSDEVGTQGAENNICTARRYLDAAKVKINRVNAILGILRDTYHVELRKSENSATYAEQETQFHSYKAQVDALSAKLKDAMSILASRAGGAGTIPNSTTQPSEPPLSMQGLQTGKTSISQQSWNRTGNQMPAVQARTSTIPQPTDYAYNQVPPALDPAFSEGGTSTYQHYYQIPEQSASIQGSHMSGLHIPRQVWSPTNERPSPELVNQARDMSEIQQPMNRTLEHATPSAGSQGGVTSTFPQFWDRTCGPMLMSQAYGSGVIQPSQGQSSNAMPMSQTDESPMPLQQTDRTSDRDLPVDLQTPHAWTYWPQLTDERRRRHR